MWFAAFDARRLHVLTQLLFDIESDPSAILPICWMEASAASAPPQTLQERWKESRPPLPATPLLLVYRIYRQSEQRERERETESSGAQRFSLSLRGRSIFLGALPSIIHWRIQTFEWKSWSPSKTRTDWGPWTQLLLKDGRRDLGFIDVLCNGCTSFHQGRVMLISSLIGKTIACVHVLVSSPGKCLSTAICVYRRPFSFSKDLTYCVPLFVSMYIWTRCRTEI